MANLLSIVSWHQKKLELMANLLSMVSWHQKKLEVVAIVVVLITANLCKLKLHYAILNHFCKNFRYRKGVLMCILPFIVIFVMLLTTCSGINYVLNLT